MEEKNKNKPNIGALDVYLMVNHPHLYKSKDSVDFIKKSVVGGGSNLVRGYTDITNWVGGATEEERQADEEWLKEAYGNLLGEAYVDTETRDNGEEVTIVARPDSLGGNLSREAIGFIGGFKGVDKAFGLGSAAIKSVVKNANKLIRGKKVAEKTTKGAKSFSQRRPFVANLIKSEAAVQVAFDPWHENFADLILNNIDENDESTLADIGRYLLEPMASKKEKTELQRRLSLFGEGLVLSLGVTGLLKSPEIIRTGAGLTIKTLDEIKNKGSKYVKDWLDRAGIKSTRDGDVIETARASRAKLVEKGKVDDPVGDIEGLEPKGVSSLFSEVDFRFSENGFLRNMSRFFNSIANPRGSKTRAMHEKYLDTENYKEAMLASINNTAARLQKGLDDIIGSKRFLGLGSKEREKLFEKISDILFNNNLSKVKGAKNKQEAFEKLLKELPEELRGPVLEMRQFQDSLSKMMLDTNLLTPAQKKTFQKNLGEYARMSYKLYDVPGYVPPKSIEKKALEFLEQEIVRKNKRGLKAGDPTVRQEAKAQLEAILTKGGGNAADFYSGLERFTKVKKDFLKGRNKKIPEPIRDLLGEIDNPLARWQKSTSKLINVIADTRFHDDMFEQGAGLYFYAKPTGRFTQQIAQGYGKLSGQYTTPELHKYFSMQKKLVETDGILGDAYRFLSLLKGISQSSKTVWSHGTHVKNMFGGVQMSLANGVNTLEYLPKALKIINAKTDKELTELYEELQSYGLLNKGVIASELKGLFADMAEVTARRGRTKTGGLNDVLRKMLESRPNKKLQNTYVAEDDMFKINMYFAELDNLKQINRLRNTPLDEAALKREAALKVRNTLPNYDLVPPLLKDLRQMPFFGRFFSFMAESVRISYNSVKEGLVEVRRGRRMVDAGEEAAGNAMIDRGTRRLASFTAVAGGGAYTAEEVSKYVVGLDDVEQESIKELLLPDYARNSKILYSQAEDGTLKWSNLSAWDAYDFPKKGLSPLIQGELAKEDDGSPDFGESQWGEKLLNFYARELAAPFVGESLIQEVISNYFFRGGRDIEGRPMKVPPTIKAFAEATGNDELALRRIEGSPSDAGFYFRNLDIFLMNMFEKLVPGSATLTSKWVNTIGKEQTDFDQDVYETDQFVKFLTGFGFNPLNKEYMENAYVYKVRKLAKQKNDLGSRWQSAALSDQYGMIL